MTVIFDIVGGHRRIWDTVIYHSIHRYGHWISRQNLERVVYIVITMNQQSIYSLLDIAPNKVVGCIIQKRLWDLTHSNTPQHPLNLGTKPSVYFISLSIIPSSLHNFQKRITIEISNTIQNIEIKIYSFFSESLCLQLFLFLEV